MKADIGFAIGPVDDSKFDKINIASEEYVLAVNKSNPLKNKTSVSFSDLKGQTLVSQSREFKVYNNVIKGCSEYGFVPDIIFETTEINLLHKLCNLKKVCAVTVKFAVSFEVFSNIVLIPIIDKGNSWELCMITKKNIYESTTVRLFKEYLIKLIKANVIM